MALACSAPGPAGGLGGVENSIMGRSAGGGQTRRCKLLTIVPVLVRCSNGGPRGQGAPAPGGPGMSRTARIQTGAASIRLGAAWW